MNANKIKSSEKIIDPKQSITKGMILLALPIFLNNLLKAFHDVVDALFIARMNATKETIDAASAALDSHWPVFGIFFALGTGIGVAIVSIVGQYIGLGNTKKAESNASKLLFLLICVGLFCNLVFFLCSDVVWKNGDLFARLMGAQGETLVFAGEYYRIRSFEFVFYFIFIAYQSIRQSTGKTVMPVILSVTGIVLNIALTGVFVLVLDMGVKGAAYATLIAQIVIVPPALIDLFCNKKDLRVSFAKMIPDKECLKMAFKIALPASLGSAIASLGFAFIKSISLRTYGDEIATGIAAGNRISSLLLNPVMAIGSVMAIYISLNIGNGQQERAKKSYIVGRNLSFIILLVLSIIAIIFRGPIVGFILNNNTYFKYEVGVNYSFWILLSQPLMGLFQAYSGLFNGSGNSKYSLYLAIIRLWLMRIPLIFLFIYVFPSVSYMSIAYALIISNFLILFIGELLRKKVNYELKVKVSEIET